MSDITYHTYFINEIPLIHHKRLLDMIKGLVEFEKTLSQEITGNPRDFPCTQSIAGFFMPDAIVLLAIEKGANKLLGFCSYYHEATQGRLIIDTLWVDPTERRRGVAKGLLVTPLTSGFSTVDIHSLANNEPAMKLYQSLGFKPYITSLTMAC